ncbi:hypothetical protein FRC12_004792 [Ceratobasidium sp. 428]|nr:hypothetical protein FRC12_004792 [Ceratobasidium sp. 428]
MAQNPLHKSLLGLSDVPTILEADELPNEAAAQGVQELPNHEALGNQAAQPDNVSETIQNRSQCLGHIFRGITDLLRWAFSLLRMLASVTANGIRLALRTFHGNGDDA